MATSINTYNVRLVLEASEYIRQSNLAREETGRLKREINSARSPMDNYHRTQLLVNKALRENAIDQATANTILSAAKQRLDDATVATEKFSVRMIKLIRDVHIATLGIRQFFMAVSQPIKMFAELQEVQASMEVLTGSTKQASALIKGFRKLAAESPMNFTAIADTARTMMLMNVATEDVLPHLKMLGDITGGNTERFKNLAYAFSQMHTAGRLLGQDLRQMSDAGFNPLNEGVKQTGKSFEELLDLQRKGMIPTELVVTWFQSYVAEGGKAFGMLDKINETSRGALNRMQSQMEMLQISVGEGLEPLTMEVARGFERWSVSLAESSRQVGNLVKVMELIPVGQNKIDIGTTVWRVSLQPVTSAFLFIESIVTHVKGTIEEIADINVRIRDFVGRWAFTEEQNAALDRWIEKQTTIQENAEKLNDVMTLAEQERIDAAIAAEEKTQEEIETLQKKLDVIKQTEKAERDARAIAEGQGLHWEFDLFEAQRESLIALEKQWQDMFKNIQGGMDPQKAQEIFDLQDQLRLHEEIVALEKEKLALAEEEDKVKKRLADNERKMRESALDAAKKHFEQERQRARKLLEDSVSQFKAVEVGSSEDVRMQAEAINRMNAPGLTSMAKETDEQLLEEARKQYAEAQLQSQKQDRQQQTLEQMLAALKNPPIKAFR